MAIVLWLNLEKAGEQERIGIFFEHKLRSVGRNSVPLRIEDLHPNEGGSHSFDNLFISAEYQMHRDPSRRNHGG